MVSFLGRLLKGMIIALGFILPGVSGGVLAAVLGIYERLIRFIAHIRIFGRILSSFSPLVSAVSWELLSFHFQ